AGAEFHVNSYTTNEQSYPAVAADSAGDFVVVWSSYGQDGYERGVFGQRFTSTGASAGTEFQVNSYTTSAQMSPAVAADAAGDFVVVWQSFYQDIDFSFSVFGQRYTSSGA